MINEVLAGEYCPLCGSRGSHFGYSQLGESLRICRCDNKAGILLSWTWESETAYENWYRHPSAYHEDEQLLNDQKPYLERQTEHLQASQFRVSMLASLYPRSKSACLLDVGCGDGMFVKVATEQGYDAYGIEPNAHVIANSPSQICSRLTIGGWHEIEGSYDFICLHDVFEHLTRPRKCLHRMQQHLKDKGRLLIEMPEFDSPNQREQGLKWNHIRPKQHVCLYSFHAALKLFDICGLELDGFYRPLSGTIGKATWILVKR